MSDTSRVFVAVSLPAETKQELYALQQNMQEHIVYAAGEKADGLVRWTSIENLHITLSFLGPINAEQRKAVREETARIAERYNPFSANITRTILAPPGNAKKLPRMIWADISQTDELMQLQGNLADAVYNREEFAYKQRERRPFRPHLTLARFRKWKLRELEQGELPPVEGDLDIAFPVHTVAVMESTLKRSGAEYTTVASFALGSSKRGKPR